MGIIGCGLISERSHLPAILRSSRSEISVLVDKDAARAEEVRERLGLSCNIATSYRDLKGHIDAAIVALPNFLHADATSSLAEQGIHVLCEKPLALNCADAVRVCEIVERTGTVLAVGFVTRFHEVTALMKTVVEQSMIGDLQSYDCEFGVNFAWPAVSGFYYDRKQAGGGVLISEAIHVLDRLLHWFGDVESLACEDNNFGGVETYSSLNLVHRGAEGKRLTGRATFSWLGNLRNTLELYGTRGRAVVWKDDRSRVGIVQSINGREYCFHMGEVEDRQRDPIDYFHLQLEDFIDAVRRGGKPLVDGREGVRSVELVERAYRQATRVRYPWMVLQP